MQTTVARKSALGSLASRSCRPVRKALACMATKSSKHQAIDIRNSGLESIADPVVQNNLKGRSRFMDKKGWKDAAGRKGKGLGVYQFQNKYGANVDGYSPIYTPDQWADTGNQYQLGTKGLIAWAGLLLILFGVGINLVVSTSALSS